jgi:hypothetical protein
MILEIKNYTTGMSPNNKTFIPHYMKIDQIIKELKGGMYL